MVYPFHCCDENGGFSPFTPLFLVFPFLLISNWTLREVTPPSAHGRDETWPQVLRLYPLPQLVDRNHPLLDICVDNKTYYYYCIFVYFQLKLKGILRHDLMYSHFTNEVDDADYQGADFKIYRGKKKN